MERRTKQIRSCREKKKYKTLEECQSRATNLWGKGIKLKPYRCKICKGLHLAKVNYRTSLEQAFCEVERKRNEKL